jgi:hypothetical protein
MRGSVVSTTHANQQPHHHQAEGEHDHLIQIHFAILNGKFEVVAVAWTTVHLEINGAVAHAAEIEAQASLGIGAAQFLPWRAIGIEQANNGPLGGLTVGKAAIKIKSNF